MTIGLTKSVGSNGIFISVQPPLAICSACHVMWRPVADLVSSCAGTKQLFCPPVPESPTSTLDISIVTNDFAHAACRYCLTVAHHLGKQSPVTSPLISPGFSVYIYASYFLIVDPTTYNLIWRTFKHLLTIYPSYLLNRFIRLNRIDYRCNPNMTIGLRFLYHPTQRLFDCPDRLMACPLNLSTIIQ